MPRFTLQILSFALLICSTALLFGEYHFPPSGQAPFRDIWPGPGYLTNDSDTIARDENLTSPNTDWTAATALFRGTVKRNAASAQRWCELGEAFGRTGDLSKGEYCYLRGAALGPHSPAILLDVGDFYFHSHQYQKALPWFSELLKTIRDPRQGYVENVFEYYEEMDVRRHGWMDAAIPDGEAARAYLTYLMTSRDAEAVMGTWQWADGRKLTDDEITVKYTDFLVRKLRFDAAARAWAKHFRERGGNCVESLRVFNGGFEQEFTGGMLDWRFSAMDGVKTARDSVSRYEGQYSLRIDFAGNDNPDFHHFGELVVLPPGRYKLDGYVRSAGIGSDEGIRLRVSGSGGRKNLTAETGDVTGTEGWTHLETVFEVAEEIRTVEVQVARRKSLRIDNQLSGTAWIDSVRLARLP